MSEKRPTFANPSKQLASIAIRIAGAGLGFAATLYATYLLGPDMAGVFFASLAWSGFLAIVARWGLQDVMLLTIPALQRRATRRQVSGRIASFFRMLIARLAILLIVCLLAWLVLNGLGIEIGLSVPSVAALTVITAILQMLSALAKSQDRPVVAFAGEFAIPPFLVLILLANWANTAPSIGLSQAAFAYAIAGMAGAILLGFLSRGSFSKIAKPKKVSRRLSQRAGTFATIELALFMTAFSSVMLMPFLLGSAETGVFNLALRIVAVATLVPSTVAAVITPALARSGKNGEKHERGETLHYARAVMAISALLYASGVGLLGPVVLAWLGPEFSDAQIPMLIMMTGFAAGLLLGPTGVVLAVDGREAIAKRVALAAAVLTLGALVIATPLFGLNGAAAVVGASFFLQRLALFLAEKMSV